MSKTKKIGNSKPCKKCTLMFEKMCIVKKINIRNIYYSNENGNIDKTNVSKLKKEYNL